MNVTVLRPATAFVLGLCAMAVVHGPAMANSGQPAMTQAERRAAILQRLAGVEPITLEKIIQQTNRPMARQKIITFTDQDQAASGVATTPSQPEIEDYETFSQGSGASTRLIQGDEFSMSADDAAASPQYRRAPQQRDAYHSPSRPLQPGQQVITFGVSEK